MATQVLSKSSAELSERPSLAQRSSVQVGLLSASRAVGQVLNALANIFIVRYLTQTEYGTYRQVYLLYSTLVIAGEFGFVESLYYFIPRQPAKRAIFLRQSILTIGVLQVLLGVLLTHFGGAIGNYFHNPAVPAYMDLLAIYLGLSVITRVWETELVAEKRVPLASLISGGSETIKVLFMFLALFLAPGIRPLLMAMAFAAGLKFLAFVIFLGREFRWFANAGSLAEGLPQWSYAAALWVPGFINTVAGQVHQYIVGYYFDPLHYAIYAVGCFQVPFLAILTNSIAEILMVRATDYQSHGRSADLYQLWCNACLKSLMLLVPIVVGLVVVAKPLIILVFTERYVASVPLFRIIVLGLIFSGIFQDPMFRAWGAMRTYSFFYVLRALLNVGLGIMLAKFWGLWGAALSTVAALAIMNTGQLFPIAKLLGVPFGRVLPWRGIAKILLCTVAVVPPAAVCVHAISSPGLALMITLFVFAACYLGLAIKLGLLSGKAMLVVLEGMRLRFGWLAVRRSEG